MFDKDYVEIIISEVPSKRNARRQIYGWFKEWIKTLDTNTLEQLLKFITGSTRVPSRKIIVCNFKRFN